MVRIIVENKKITALELGNGTTLTLRQPSSRDQMDELEEFGKQLESRFIINSSASLSKSVQTITSGGWDHDEIAKFLDQEVASDEDLFTFFRCLVDGTQKQDRISRIDLLTCMKSDLAHQFDSDAFRGMVRKLTEAYKKRGKETKIHQRVKVPIAGNKIIHYYKIRAEYLPIVRSWIDNHRTAFHRGGKTVH